MKSIGERRSMSANQLIQPSGIIHQCIHKRFVVRFSFEFVASVKTAKYTVIRVDMQRWAYHSLRCAKNAKRVYRVAVSVNNDGWINLSTPTGDFKNESARIFYDYWKPTDSVLSFLFTALNNNDQITRTNKPRKLSQQSGR